jgi:hypothetical protein
LNGNLVVAKGGNFTNTGIDYRWQAIVFTSFLVEKLACGAAAKR